MKSKTPALNLAKLQPHPLAKMVPMIGTEEYKNLCKSIKEHGLHNEIVLFEGGILDGNSRYTACKKAKVEPRFRQFNPAKDGPAIDFLIANSLARRNLTPSQLATLGANLAEELKRQEKAAKDAEKAAAKDAKGAKPAKPTKKEKKGKTTAKAAKLAGSSTRSVEKATALKESDPAKFEEVQAGKTTLAAATKEVEKKKTKAQVESEEFDTCRKLVSDVYGETDAAKAEKNLPAKDFIKLAGLDEDEMRRVLPFIVTGGWTLKAAMGYKSSQLSMGHTIRNLCDRALAANVAEYTLDLPEWTIKVSRKAAAPVNPDKE